MTEKILKAKPRKPSTAKVPRDSEAQSADAPRQIVLVGTYRDSMVLDHLVIGGEKHVCMLRNYTPPLTKGRENDTIRTIKRRIVIMKQCYYRKGVLAAGVALTLFASSGAPARATTEYVTLDGAAVRVAASEPKPMEARSRSWLVSNAIRLYTTIYNGLSVIIR